MMRSFVMAGASVAVLTLSVTAFAQGTATEAKAMLEKAAVAVKGDKMKTLDMINKGEGGSWTAISTCFASTSGTVRSLLQAPVIRLERR
jgi:hypothetical protein